MKTEPTRVRVPEKRRPRGVSARPRRGPRGSADAGRGIPVGVWLAAALGIAVLGAFYFGLVGVEPSSGGAGPARPAAADRPADPRITLLAGQSAPDFTLPNVEGGAVRLSDLTARSNVLLFFQEGIMCPPCWQQMRDLKRDADKLAAMKVQLVTITVDPIEQLRSNVGREQVEGMTLLADAGARVSKQYQMTFVSMHAGERPGHGFMLVGMDGKILWRHDFQEMYVPNPQILEPVAQALAGR